MYERETTFFYLCKFCDSVIDIREQFPLLLLDLSLKIAKTLGIKHPIVSATKILKIICTNFLLTRCSGGHTWYEVVAVQSKNSLGDERTAELLDLQRIWWQLLGVKFHVFVCTELN